MRYRTLKALHKPELALKAYEEFVFLNDSLFAKRTYAKYFVTTFDMLTNSERSTIV
ncbi:MAG: hypothetical protein IPI91_16280 [Flavobacteriales bacterium]|nr:hypothetical protein [Flavobacteriales bacterium]